MTESPAYIRHADHIRRDEFLLLFSEKEKPEDWFSEQELEIHPFPKNAGSLAARYLVKKRIMQQLGIKGDMREISILNDDLGKPEVLLGDCFRQEMEKLGIEKIICSLSHSRNFVAGMTLFERVHPIEGIQGQKDDL